MVDFPNDASAKYCTIHWQDILLAFGEGCFRLELNYTIAGVSGSFIWGEYELQEFTTEGALGSARLRVKFNGVHQIEGINFRGSNVEDTMRFKGFIGHRQPNTQFDNIIYGDRVMKRVIRENLNEYEIQTDPISECVSKRILDLYLVSENELFIADYNAHNHSYRINDLPVIVEKSASVTYYDLSRLASIKAFVSDKIKNQRTFY
jgi:hypothetical protein